MPNACGEIWAVKSAIRPFIRQPSYRRQPKIMVDGAYGCDSAALQRSSDGGRLLVQPGSAWADGLALRVSTIVPRELQLLARYD